MKKQWSVFFGLLLVGVLLAPASPAQSLAPGTQIQVQLLDRLDTGTAQAGQQFSATLAEPIQMPSGAVWPKGTQVKGTVVAVTSSGRLDRPASITLELTQIGNAPLETNPEQIDGKSHAPRDAALIGGVAALGALLGGAADGAKGAVIGAAAGAGAGTVAAAATGKQEIVLGAETPLTFVVGDPAAQPEAAAAPAPPAEPAPVQEQPVESAGYQSYAPEQLDNLLAPIALYPDPLLAQVLVAATFPDQLQDAAQWVRVNGPAGIDYQPWDVSVKAVAHYPTVLDMMNDQLDWTTTVGQAYAYQSTDVMASVQRLRQWAYSQGNLFSAPEQQVVADRGEIQILPAQPRLIFVPVYDSSVIYARRVYRPFFGFGGFYSFGPGYAIGAWLNYDLDWGSRRVVYDGWDGHRVEWRERSRPYVQVTNVYVDNRYEQVNVNRRVVDRHVDYENVRRYNTVHREITYDDHARMQPQRERDDLVRASSGAQPPSERVNDHPVDRDRHDAPAVQPQPVPQPANSRSFERAPQPAPAVQQSIRTQPPDSRSPYGRGNDEGIGRGRGNQPPAIQAQPAPPPANSRSFERAPQPAPAVQQSIRTQPPAAPAGAATHPAPQAAPQASVAAHAPNGDHANGRGQQQQHPSAAGNKKDNGGDDKKNDHH